MPEGISQKVDNPLDRSFAHDSTLSIDFLSLPPTFARSTPSKGSPLHLTQALLLHAFTDQPCRTAQESTRCFNVWASNNSVLFANQLHLPMASRRRDCAISSTQTFPSDKHRYVGVLSAMSLYVTHPQSGTRTSLSQLRLERSHRLGHSREEMSALRHRSQLADHGLNTDASPTREKTSNLSRALSLLPEVRERAVWEERLGRFWIREFWRVISVGKTSSWALGGTGSSWERSMDDTTWRSDLRMRTAAYIVELERRYRE